ncbi:MAG TPA: potassium/proton antiporter [Solirubrobacterales bacterium]|jgi:cell volume regulation protein A|nr:potassium/proton antiporter [Solirubrobacterales bacterium]
MGAHDAQLILIAGSLLAAGIVGALLADRVRVPGLLLFLALGMIAGSQGIGGIEFSNMELARTLGTIALILILFEGGLTAGWSEIRPVLGTAASLATIGTVVTALIAGLAAKLIFDLGTLEGMIVGAAIAATDSAAIFAVLRRSTLEKRLARSLEGESGMNDPVALLLVIGFIEWIQEPGFGLADMAGLLAVKIAVGIAVGYLVGRLAVEALGRVRLPTDGIYPVATVAIAALAYGLAEIAHGSGLLATYLAALALGGANIPARRTVVAFHEGLGWVAQLSLFILLGLLVFPSQLDDVAVKGIALSAVLILVARPLATFLATALAPMNVRERLMLGWAGLRGATPIWLATFPVVAGIAGGEEEFAIVFFVVVTSTLVQGASFEPLATRLGLTTDEPALPRRLLESGRIRRMGGDVIAYRIPEGAAIAGHRVRELELPREALVNVIVRDGNAMPPRGSTELQEGDELHILVRSELRDEVEGLTGHWAKGPIGKPAPPPLPRRGASQVFTVRPARGDGELGEEIDGVPIVRVMRDRSERGAYLVALADGRYAVLSSGLVAIGGRRALAGWCEGRAAREDVDASERAWWQEVTGALIARGRSASVGSSSDLGVTGSGIVGSENS